MIKNQRISIFRFFKWVSEKYAQLERETLPNICKIIGITNNKNSQLVKIQFSGQSLVLEINPIKLIELNLFEYFSTQDKKLLFSLVYKKNLQISDSYYCKTTEKEMIILTDTISRNRLTLPVDAVSSNKILIDQLNPRDAQKIGFISGMNYIKNLFKNSQGIR